MATLRADRNEGRPPTAETRLKVAENHSSGDYHQPSLRPDEVLLCCHGLYPVHTDNQISKVD